METQIVINYSPSNIEEFERVFALVAAHKPKINVAAPVAPAREVGPFEAEWKAKTGSARMKLTDDERGRGLSREDVAKERLERLEQGDVAPVVVESAEAPEFPDDADLF